MGASFSSQQLAGAVSEGVPSISYSYSPTNTANFGFDIYYAAGGLPISSTITPVLHGPTGTASASCNHFPKDVSTSIECQTKVTDLSPGLYTINFAYDAVFGGVISNDQPLIFSIAASTAPPTVTRTATATATATVTNTGQATSTATTVVPLTTVTVTVVSTTVISSSTSLTTLRTGIVSTVTKACNVAPTTTDLIPPSSCNQDNCLRAMLHRPATNSGFCSSYTMTTNYPTPSYLTMCLGLSSRVSSACTCFAKATPSAAGQVVRKMQPAAARVVVQDGNVYAPPDYTFYPDPAATNTVTSTTTVTPTTSTTTTTTTRSSGTQSSSTSIATTTITVIRSIATSSYPISTITINPNGC